MNVGVIVETKMTDIQIDQLELYAYADPAAGKEARRSRSRRARQCIVVGARDWLFRWFWPYIWAGRETASDFKERILSVQEEWSPRKFGLEANGMQVLFGALVREEAKERFGRVKMVPVYVPTNVDKNFRIRTGLEPLILQGRFFLQSKEIEARSELQGFPTALTKDIVDAMELCVDQVAPKRVVKNEDNAEREVFAAYLRKSGMPAGQIEQELMKRFGGMPGDVLGSRVVH